MSVLVVLLPCKQSHPDTRKNFPQFSGKFLLIIIAEFAQQCLEVERFTNCRCVAHRDGGALLEDELH
jgi:hypothetical protein